MRDQYATPHRCYRCGSPLSDLRTGRVLFDGSEGQPSCGRTDCALGEASCHSASVEPQKEVRTVGGSEVVVTVFVTTFRD